MAGRIVVYGATGYTGGLIAQRLVTAGESPLLAGRDPARLADVAERLGGLDFAKADALRQNSVFSLVKPGDVLVSTVGPFSKYGSVAVRAAVAAGATYMDSTGEPAFIRRVFEQFDQPARKKGAALLTAAGFDWVPGALAAALALEDAGPEAVRADVGYFVKGATASPGTRESLVGATLDRGFAWREGELRTERGATRVRSFEGAGSGFSVGGAEHFTLPAAYPRLREVNVFLGAGPLARGVQLASAATTLAQLVPGSRTVMQLAGERVAALAPGRTEGRASSRVVATVHDSAGRQLSETTLDGPDPYEFTASFMAWTARRAAAGGLEGVGALSPLLAFGGLAGLHEGCAAAGISERG